MPPEQSRKEMQAPYCARLGGRAFAKAEAQCNAVQNEIFLFNTPFC
jgi:hypothetical protein